MPYTAKLSPGGWQKGPGAFKPSRVVAGLFFPLCSDTLQQNNLTSVQEHIHSVLNAAVWVTLEISPVMADAGEKGDRRRM